MQIVYSAVVNSIALGSRAERSSVVLSFLVLFIPLPYEKLIRNKWHTDSLPVNLSHCLCVLDLNDFHICNWYILNVARKYVVISKYFHRKMCRIIYLLFFCISSETKRKKNGACVFLSINCSFVLSTVCCYCLKCVWCKAHSIRFYAVEIKQWFAGWNLCDLSYPG